MISAGRPLTGVGSYFLLKSNNNSTIETEYPTLIQQWFYSAGHDACTQVWWDIRSVAVVVLDIVLCVHLQARSTFYSNSNREKQKQRKHTTAEDDAHFVACETWNSSYALLCAAFFHNICIITFRSYRQETLFSNIDSNVSASWSTPLTLSEESVRASTCWLLNGCLWIITFI